MTIILDGKATAEKILSEIKEKTATYETKPKLAVILVGSDPASQIYVRNKQKKAIETGFESITLPYPEYISEENLLEQIYILNETPSINAILVQLPLPEHINTAKIMESIDPIKDVDGFTPYNFGKLSLGYNPYAVPCTPKGIIRLLDEYKIEIEGKNALVIGRSNIVGKPVSLLLQQRNATVIMAHSKTKNLKELAKNADIIISATGKAKIFDSEYTNENSIIMDVGISRSENGLCGDFNFKDIIGKVAYVTPVPGGVGPMTIAMLMENTLELFNVQEKLKNSTRT